jgi:hypothetical protein
MTAPSLTISTTQNGTLSLSPSDNPVLITGAGAGAVGDVVEIGWRSLRVCQPK